MNKSKQIILAGLVGIISISPQITTANEIFNYRITSNDASLGLGTIASKHNCYSKLKLIAQLNNLNSPYSISKGKILKLPSKYCIQENFESKLKNKVPTLIPIKSNNLNIPFNPKIQWEKSKMTPVQIGKTETFYRYQINPNNHCLYENTYSIFGKLLKSHIASRQIPCNFR